MILVLSIVSALETICKFMNICNMLYLKTFEGFSSFSFELLGLLFLEGFLLERRTTEVYA